MSDPNDTGRQNTLGLSGKRLNEVLDRLEASQAARPPIKRHDARWPFRQPSIGVIIDHPGGTRVELRMACRNLSRHGAGFLHSGFIYPGTTCTVLLPHDERGETAVPGKVVRCEHRQGMLHEVGVKFDQPIDLRGHANPGPASQMFAVEMVKPEEVEGHLLYIEPNKLDAQLVRHYLAKTSVSLKVVATVEEAVEALDDRVDLILTEFKLGDSTGADLALQLRSENVSAPIILTSLDTTPRVTSSVGGRLIQAFLAKPFTQERLLQALMEFFEASTRDAKMAVANVDASFMASIKPEIDRLARCLDEAIDAANAMDAVSTCLELQHVVGGIGLNELAGSLNSIVATLSATMDVADVSRELRSVAERCRRFA